MIFDDQNINLSASTNVLLKQVRDLINGQAGSGINGALFAVKQNNSTVPAGTDFGPRGILGIYDIDLSETLNATNGAFTINNVQILFQQSGKRDLEGETIRVFVMTDIPRDGAGNPSVIGDEFTYNNNNGPAIIGCLNIAPDDNPITDDTASMAYLSFQGIISQLSGNTVNVNGNNGHIVLVACWLNNGATTNAEIDITITSTFNQ
jgi:hypothetical protein